MSTDSGTAVFIQRVLIVLGLVVLGLFLWRIAYALLLGFGGVLVAVFLRGLARKLHQWTGLSMGWSLALISIGLVGLLGLTAMLIGPSIASQFRDLNDTLTQGIEQVRGFLAQQPWGQRLLRSVTQNASQGGDLLRSAAKVFAGAADALLAFVLVLFAGVYFALRPDTYADGLVRLVPKPRQARAREVLQATGNALWLWLLGQFVVMAIVGVLTTVGLLLAGVPLAPALGLIAGLLEFVPFLGPIVAAVPVLLVALTVDPQTALYAMLVLLVIQQTESNLLEPVVERRAVALPPVLVLVGTIAFMLLFGVLGAVFATPLLVVTLVAVKMLYMEDALGEPVHLPGERSP